MSSINLSVEIPPKSRKTVIQEPLDRSFRVEKVEILTGKDEGIYLTEIWNGDKKVFLPWKISVKRLGMLEGKILEANKAFRMIFSNEKNVTMLLVVKISGSFV